jgi:hypothetical protein
LIGIFLLVELLVITLLLLIGIFFIRGITPTVLRLLLIVWTPKWKGLEDDELLLSDGNTTTSLSESSVAWNESSLLTRWTKLGILSKMESSREHNKVSTSLSYLPEDDHAKSPPHAILLYFKNIKINILKKLYAQINDTFFFEIARFVIAATTRKNIAIWRTTGTIELETYIGYIILYYTRKKINTKVVNTNKKIAINTWGIFYNARSTDCFPEKGLLGSIVHRIRALTEHNYKSNRCWNHTNIKIIRQNKWYLLFWHRKIRHRCYYPKNIP